MLAMTDSRAEGPLLWRIPKGPHAACLTFSRRTGRQAPQATCFLPSIVPTDTDATTPAIQTSTDAPAAEDAADYVIVLDPEHNVATDELLRLFPITYQTPAATEFNKLVQNRMLNGFNRWNMGYEAWEHWGEVLYHPESLYNVNAVRMTLAEYQACQQAALSQMEIKMGTFNNMVLVDDWMAIQYDITTIDPETDEGRPGTTMEFARFGDYGELGAKVDEGWGGTRNENYECFLHVVSDDCVPHRTPSCKRSSTPS